MEFGRWNCRGDHKVQTHTHRGHSQYLFACLLCLLAYNWWASCSWIYFLSLAHCLWQTSCRLNGIIVSRENLRRDCSIGTSPNKLVFCKNHTLSDFLPPFPKWSLLCHSEPLSSPPLPSPPKSPLCDPAATHHPFKNPLWLSSGSSTTEFTKLGGIHPPW